MLICTYSPLVPVWLKIGDKAETFIIAIDYLAGDGFVINEAEVDRFSGFECGLDGAQQRPMQQARTAD